MFVGIRMWKFTAPTAFSDQASICYLAKIAGHENHALLKTNGYEDTHGFKLPGVYQCQKGAWCAVYCSL